MHTHRSLTESALRLAGEMRLRAGEVFLTCLPMFFAGANSTMSAPLLRGCTIVCDDFSPERFRAAVERHRVSATITVPTMVSQVLRHVGEDDDALTSLTNWCYAGDALPGSELQRAMGRYGPVFSGYYGQLESGLVGSTFFSEDHVVAAGAERRLRSAGRPTIGAGLRVVDIETGRDVPHDGEARGEIWIRTPSVMKGYWGRPELTRERLGDDGWLRTTDIGVQDAEGFLYIVDRATDMIITGGINVFPREIEEVIAGQPGVRAVAVLGMPSDEWGQEITACVVPDGEYELPALEAAIVERCRAQLSGFKKPRRVVVRDSLPMTGSGKVQKSRLRDLLLGEQHAA
jgi:acyl-CoA synthetase (AMP-forming)/AMP-acid ligase II